MADLNDSSSCEYLNLSCSKILFAHTFPSHELKPKIIMVEPPTAPKAAVII